MANNRLILVDRESGEAVTIAKGWGNGWELRADTEDRLQRFLNGKDVIASETGSSNLVLVTEHDLADFEKSTGINVKWGDG